MVCTAGGTVAQLHCDCYRTECLRIAPSSLSALRARVLGFVSIILHRLVFASSLSPSSFISFYNVLFCLYLLFLFLPLFLLSVILSLIFYFISVLHSFVNVFIFLNLIYLLVFLSFWCLFHCLQLSFRLFVFCLFILFHFRFQRK